jgi:hypothetical protein
MKVLSHKGGENMDLVEKRIGKKWTHPTEMPMVRQKRNEKALLQDDPNW